VRQSADTLCNFLEKEGFSISRGIAQMEHAFVASFGEGSSYWFSRIWCSRQIPSQVCDLAEKPFREKANARSIRSQPRLGAVGGAIGIKDLYGTNNLAGTVKVFDVQLKKADGKAFMAPGWCVRRFRFYTYMASYGYNNSTSSTPSLKEYLPMLQSRSEYGRSVLDAAELMNVGVNFTWTHYWWRKEYIMLL